MKRTTMALGLSMLALSGCYMRMPLETTAPSPNTRVVATLTDSGTVAMGTAIGPGAVEVEGIISTAAPEQWTLQMLRVDLRDGRSIGWNRELVSFPKTVLANPNIVVLDKKKSWLVAGGITIGAFLAARSFGLIGADEVKDNTPVPQVTRISGPGN